MRVSSNRRPRGGRSNAGGNRPGSGNNRRQNGGNRNFDSNGPDGKIRGTANQVYDKYMALGTDAQTSGDRVAAENYFQHAEHYFRIIAANTAPPKEKQPSENSDNPSASSEDENTASIPRKSGSRRNEEQASENEENDGARSDPVVVDLSATDQPAVETDREKNSTTAADNSEDVQADTEKPKRKVSRTRTLRRRTSSRNVSEKDTEEVNTTE